MMLATKTQIVEDTGITNESHGDEKSKVTGYIKGNLCLTQVK